MSVRKIIQVGLLTTILSCSVHAEGTKGYNSYPTPRGSWRECVYSPGKSVFSLWAPTASEVRLQLYASAKDAKPYRVLILKERKGEGLWGATADGDLKGQFYTFQVKVDGSWLAETPGLWAKAVSVNGRRAAIIDMKETNPEGWTADVRPALHSAADIVIYEMHHRDFSASASSGIVHKGKFLALTETGTRTAEGYTSGIDHLKELGVTHVHLLPSFDYASVDEEKSGQYNWGYDPQNYNVPDGSYSTDPYTPVTRILEFKEMVQALHKAGIRVILDVVYNHTFDINHSNFQLTVPDYFYRKKADGTYSNASGCGNETASERPMMRRFMIQSVLYWAQEYHIDGFRFDLMGVHDITTMRDIRKALDAVDPSIFIYGEGWAAGSPSYPAEKLAMKANMKQLPHIAAFGDELRDAIRGPFSDDKKPAFLAAVPGNEISVKFGIVGAVQHPQVICSKVNYSKEPWALQPTQAISYVSCHDDMCLVDRLRSSIPNVSEEDRIRLDKLAQTIVLTSQGVPFLFNGEEMYRDKKGVHNSFNSPDSINVIDWSLKALHHDIFEYYKNLIALRKAHPAFRMGSADAIRHNLVFLPVGTDNVVAYTINNHANGDKAAQIVVVFNANARDVEQKVDEGTYTVVCRDGVVNAAGLGTSEGGMVMVPPRSALIMYK
jgi:pullulanase